MVAFRRVRAHAALFGALLGLSLLLSAVATGLVGYLDAQSRAAVTQTLAELHGADGELRFDAPKGDDPAAQDARARAIIQRELDRAGGPGMPLRLTTTTTTGGADWLWVLSPVAAAVEPADLAAIATVGTQIENALVNDSAVAVQGVEKSGRLDAHARALQLAIAPLAAVEPVPLLLIAAIGVVALAELGRLLAGVRTRELALLRSRGASPARVGATTAVETGLVSLLGAALGATAAAGVLALIGSPIRGAAPVASVVLSVVVAATVLVAGIALQSARRSFQRGAADEVGRSRRFAAPALLLLLTVATALSVWRFLQFGSPLAPTASGAAVDPLAVLAPALCLAEVAVLGVAVFPFVARMAERAAIRGTGMRDTLVWAQLARRVRLIASPMIVLALAGGGLVVAAAYEPTWRAGDLRTGQLHVGADLLVTTDRPADAATLATVPGVDAVTLAQLGGATLDDDSTVSVTAVPAAGFAATASDAHGAVDVKALARDITTRPTGVPVPASATALRATVSWTQSPPALTAQLVCADGRVAAAAFSGVPAETTGTAVVTAPVPTCHGGWTLVTLDAFLNGSPQPIDQPIPLSSGSVTALSALTPGGAAAVVTAGPWIPKVPNQQAAAVGPLGYSVTAFSTVDVRMQPATTPGTPIVLSKAFADRMGARVGDPLALDIGIVPGPLNARVAGVVDQVPGSAGSRGILIDLAALQTQTLRGGGDADTPSTAWVRTTDATGTANRIEHAVPGARVSGPGLGVSADVLSAVPRALWLGMIGGAVLALISLAAFAGEMVRLRADEVAVLRAVGMAPARQSGARRGELTLVACAAAVIGLVGGAVTTALVVPGLAGAAILAPFPGETPALHFDGIAFAVAIFGVAAVVALIAGVYGAVVGRQARTLTSPEPTR